MYARRRPGSTPTRTWPWPGPPTPRWRWPGSPVSASSTTCTTGPAASRMPIPNEMGAGAHRGRPAGRYPDHPARHALPYLHSGWRRAGRAAAAVRRRGRGRLGRAGGGLLNAAEPHARIGAAAHSVRAVPAASLGAFATHSAGLPAHVHLSEQRAENEACLARHGCTPTELLAAHGLLGPGDDRRARHPPDRPGLAPCWATRAPACASAPPPSGISPTASGPARALVDAGSPLSLGSDSHAVIDLFEEARAVELNERLRDERRGHFAADELLGAATRPGIAALGWPDAGVIALGRAGRSGHGRLDTVRAAGFDPPAGAAVLFAAARRRRHARGGRRPDRSCRTASIVPSTTCRPRCPPRSRRWHR